MEVSLTVASTFTLPYQHISQLLLFRSVTIIRYNLRDIRHNVPNKKGLLEDIQNGNRYCTGPHGAACVFPDLYEVEDFHANRKSGSSIFLVFSADSQARIQAQ
jgi:hypothetical protein